MEALWISGAVVVAGLVLTATLSALWREERRDTWLLTTLAGVSGGGLAAAWWL